MKNRIWAAVIIIWAVLITGCGLSEENLKLATDSRDSLTKAKTEAEAMYGNLTVDTYGDELNSLSGQYSEYEQLELKKIKNDEVQDVISKMQELTDSYNKLFDEMEKELNAEKAKTAEEEKYKEVECFLENKSGSELSGIVLKDVTKGEDSGNLLVDGQTLPSGRILSGVTLSIYSESTAWQLVTTDTLGNENTYDVTFEDIENISQNGMSLVIHAPESGVEVAGYVKEEQPEASEEGNNSEVSEDGTSSESSDEVTEENADNATEETTEAAEEAATDNN